MAEPSTSVHRQAKLFTFISAKAEHVRICRIHVEMRSAVIMRPECNPKQTSDHHAADLHTALTSSKGDLTVGMMAIDSCTFHGILMNGFVRMSTDLCAARYEDV